jgi:hypothetical protein
MQSIKNSLIHGLIVTLFSGLSSAVVANSVTLSCEITSSHNMRTNQYLFGDQLADPNATIYFTTTEPHALSVEGLVILNESVLLFTEEPNEYRILTFPDQSNFQNYLSINRTSLNVVHLRSKLKTDMSLEYNELGEELRCRISKPRI